MRPGVNGHLEEHRALLLSKGKGEGLDHWTVAIPAEIASALPEAIG